ncbi:MAG TPA: hypothetical protein VF267_05860 [Gammaproteobacteria bacterium]
MTARLQHGVHTAAAIAAGRWLLVLLIILVLWLPGAAHGAPAPAGSPDAFLQEAGEPEFLPGWRLRMGVLATDNITRSADPPGDEIIGVGEFGANWRYLGTRFAGGFDGTIAYRHYTQSSFDDEARANFLAAGNLFIIPDTFDWHITDRLANAPVDPLATASPTNIQLVNVLETGPRVTLRPGATNELTIAASRAMVEAEESPIDHMRDTGTASLFHDFSANSSAGIVVNAYRVNFEPEALAPDFEQGDAQLEYLSRTETRNLSIAGGASRVELADGFTRETGTGWIRFGARRTSDSYIYAAAERRAGDTATAMLEDDLLLEEYGTATLIVTGDPFLSDSAVLRYTRGWRAHEWFVAGSARELDYFLSPLDQEQRGFQLGAQLMFSSRMQLDVTAASNDIEYLDFTRSDTIRRFSAEADYRIDRGWSLVTGLHYLDRESTDPTYSFDEVMLTLFLSFSPRGRNPLESRR